jgi:erythritol/L-threitol dehydrogenase
VISGAGPIGLGMIAAAKMRSPQRIIALDCNDLRLDIARDCGADVVLNPLRDNVVARIREMTEDGCDVYFEASGNPASVVQGVNACRKAATFVSFSVFGRETQLDWTIIGDTKEVRRMPCNFSARSDFALTYRYILCLFQSLTNVYVNALVD